ncbi:MAG: ABC transporter ATP-binding protein [Planctomycetes bacterium]|jgi:predicted ABC-type transport system involved in lysophospholipase L1 biosynthesis ATPase subunit|nr:ABC transporter ATP-binding protein [Planctomycetota bacterium]MBT4028406.1 ABC transporter ATP-binding protein [Planctomycetota bacterium]MBT4559723.1 ABC transporter ATP-binding protein [Planctomycetota bacterium]MBT5102234.1 ABC transporter ATP-binding protein [Planctomycetota bacterium]MBT7012607.1 ABC transporter ATP-binding protein [Planctomycetota bacterium]
MNNSTTPVLDARGLEKSFCMGASQLRVLRGVDLALHSGEVCALRGTSGSGKSTLLHLLGLLDTTDVGSLHLAGLDCTKLGRTAAARQRAKQVGFVFQQFQLLPELDALQNVLMPRRLACGWSWWSRRRDEYARAKQILSKVGLSERMSHRPTQLSGGEQQRVAVARALVSKPALLLADEPTGNLDTQTGNDVLALLLGLAREQGAAVLLATHSRSLADACDREILLVDGKLEML